MKRNFGKHISNGARMLKEDMAELQRMIKHKSVYAKQSFREYTRHPKHIKNQNYEFYDGYIVTKN